HQFHVFLLPQFNRGQVQDRNDLLYGGITDQCESHRCPLRKYARRQQQKTRHPNEFSHQFDDFTVSDLAATCLRAAMRSSSTDNGCNQMPASRPVPAFITSLKAVPRGASRPKTIDRGPKHIHEDRTRETESNDVGSIPINGSSPFEESNRRQTPVGPFRSREKHISSA